MTSLPPHPVIIVFSINLTRAEGWVGWSSKNFPAESQLFP